SVCLCPFLQVLRCFSSLCSLKTPYVFRSLMPSFDSGNPKRPLLDEHFRTPLSKLGFPIRISADQSSFAAPRGFSQLSTSFIASQRQGIHQMPLFHLIALIINAHPALGVRSRIRVVRLSPAGH